MKDRRFYFSIFLLGLLLLFSFDLKSQNRYAVNTVSLNVREGAGTEYASIGKLKNGDELLVYEIKDGWAKINFLNTEGYVNSTYLRLINNASDNQISQKAETENSIWLYIFLFFVLIIWITISRYKKRCSNCKKWNVMRKVNTEKVNEKQSTIKKEVKITDIKGQVHTNYQFVPATIYYYHVYRKCKLCGYMDIVSKSEKIEN